MENKVILPKTLLICGGTTQAAARAIEKASDVEVVFIAGSEQFGDWPSAHRLIAKLKSDNPLKSPGMIFKDGPESFLVIRRSAFQYTGGFSSPDLPLKDALGSLYERCARSYEFGVIKLKQSDKGVNKQAETKELTSFVMGQLLNDLVGGGSVDPRKD